MKWKFYDIMRILNVCLLALLLGASVIYGGEENGEKEDVGTVVGIDLGTTYSW